MTQAVAGHGATIAMEQDPVSLPGQFTTIAELNGDIAFPELSRGETEVTPHQDNMDSWVLGVPRRGPLTFGVNWIFDDATHDHLTGLLKAFIENQTRGFRVRGPGGTENTDEWIMSGKIQAVTQTSPVREGARTSDVTVRMSGPMIIDGVSFGA
jgi:hypothetical protein